MATVSLDAIAELAHAIAEGRTQLEAQLAERDDAIRRAFNDGNPIGAIAGAAQLTPARISAILDHPHGSVGRPRRSPSPR